MSENKNSSQGVSRRGLFGTLVVGAATSAAAQTVLARPSDIVMDSAGRVLVDGAALPAGSFQVAATKRAVRDRDNTSCTNSGGCGGGTNTGCTNTKGCLEAAPGRTMQMNSPATDPGTKPNTSPDSNSRK
jgi:hypothetical protein